MTPPLHVVCAERAAADLMFAELWDGVHITALMPNIRVPLMSPRQERTELHL